MRVRMSIDFIDNLLGCGDEILDKLLELTPER